MYIAVSVLRSPALSVALTVNEWGPGELVSIALPLATGPAQEVIVAPPAASHEYDAVTCWPRV
jgi:hypothetical protein